MDRGVEVFVGRVKDGREMGSVMFGAFVWRLRGVWRGRRVLSGGVWRRWRNAGAGMNAIVGGACLGRWMGGVGGGCVWGIRDLGLSGFCVAEIGRN